MPKVTLSETQAFKERLRDNLYIAKCFSGGRNADLAKIMCVSENTVSKRFDNPCSLRADEIRRICKSLKISIGDFLDKTLTVATKGGDEK